MNVKNGISIEITKSLSSDAANTIAQWIGSYTVIKNQKSILANDEYDHWIAQGKREDDRPIVNTQAAHLTKEFPFLKDVPCQIRRNAGAKWFEAMNAAKSGLRKRPRVKSKYKKRNCYVTNELFDVQDLDEKRCLIQLKKDATKKNAGNYLAGLVMPFPKKDAGKALFLSRQGARFWMSMSFDKSLDVETESELRKRVSQMTDEQLSELTTGFDLGVKRQVTGSNRVVYHLPDEAQQKLKALEKRKIRYQRRYARVARANDRATGKQKRPRTNGEKKILAKIAKYSKKKAFIQHNNSHYQSKKIASDVPLIAVFENLKINNMVRNPKAKQCPETGKWLRNGAAAKRGLNKAILSANMGQIRQFAEYKLKERGKLFLKVKPHHSSQECSVCNFTHKDNRLTQEKFQCLSCNHKANADDNASIVVKSRGITHIRSEAFSQEKTVRKISARRKKANELSSSGSGDNVSLAIKQATICDALNSKLTASNGGLLEARRL